MERKLAAIFSADVKGYSRLMGDNEEATIRTLTAYRQVMTTLIQQHRGRVVDSPGDNLLAEFASAVDAVQGAVAIQQELKVRNADLPAHRRMEFRIGINVGDVVTEDERLYGDGVNIAARLEGLAEPGGICISGTVHDQVENKLALSYEYLGEQTVKNIEKPVRVWRVREPGTATAESAFVLRQAQHERFQKPVTLSLSKGDRLIRPVLVAAGILIAGALVTILYPSFPTLITRHSSLVTQEAQPPSLPLPDKPSIAVLPFVNMSNDPEQEYFSDGMAEDLTTELAKLSSLFVIARNSASVYKGKTVDIKEVSRSLGVRYVLEGSVRKADDRVRVTTQLLDGPSATHLWAENYDRELKDIFAVQDEIKQQVVAALKVKLTEAERERVRRIPTENLNAYDSVLRGREYYWRFTKETNAQARQMFEHAIELAPTYAEAYARLGLTYWQDWFFQWDQDAQNQERAFELVQKSIALDDSLPMAHSLLGTIYLYNKRQYEQAIAEGERAIALDPNCAQCYVWLGGIVNFAGQPEETIGLVEKAIRLDPYYPFGPLSILGQAYFLMERYEEAIATCQKALAVNPHFLAPHFLLAGIYSLLGREEEAQAEAAIVLKTSPNFSVETLRQRSVDRDQVRQERFLDALRKAGLK